MSSYSHPPPTIAAAPCGDGGTPVGRDVGETSEAKRTVYIVEDESCVQRALVRLMRAAGMRAEAFSGVEELLAASIEREAACAVVDVDLDRATSLELPDRLRRGGLAMPVIFITAWDSPQMREKIRLAGGAGYFRKPVDDQALIDAIKWAIADTAAPGRPRGDPATWRRTRA